MSKRKARPANPYVKDALKAANGFASDTERALAQGDCGEAADSLRHAYWAFGAAEGYTRALRELKGRSGQGTSVLADKRRPQLLRLAVRVRRCAFK